MLFRNDISIRSGQEGGVAGGHMHSDLTGSGHGVQRDN